MSAYNARILSKLKEYAALRKSLALIPDSPVIVNTAVITEQPHDPDAMQVDESFQEPKPESVRPKPNGSPVKLNGDGPAAVPAPHPPAKGNTRELLSSIAQMSDEAVRSSREKLNITRFACGLVRVPSRTC